VPYMGYETTDQLAAALVEVQLELKNPKFDSTNPHFKNKYPSLAGCRDTIMPIAAKHGIAILQNLVTNPDGVGCETILIHKSGQQMRFGPLYLPASKHDPQGFGSCATYARRYSLLAAFNVVGDEDDDANKGTDSAPSKYVSVAVNKFRKALKEESDPAIFAAHNEIVEDQEFYSNVWRELNAGERRQIKEAIARMKEGQTTMLPNGKAA